jgi:nucleoside phosphorylase
MSSGAGRPGAKGESMVEAVIQPRPGKNAPKLGPVAVMAATEPDVAALRSRLGFESDPGRRLYISRLYTSSESLPEVCLAGPVVGAPYAVMIAETLIAWGARRLVFLGWCGSLTEAVAIGDLVLPTSAFVDEGTSRHYAADASESAASGAVVAALSAAGAALGAGIRAGAVWTTDAPFRETREKVRAYRQRGALGVEMECSALFTLGAFRAVETGALLVVSDDLSSLTWVPGFKDPRFARGREAAGRTIASVLACRMP